MRHTTARIGADVGGTFTDIVLIDAQRGVALRKLPSTPDDFGRAVVDGVSDLLPAHAVPPQAVADVVHGTTVATNTILEFKGALTGLLTTRGFRDVLELRRLRVPKLYDLFWDKPRPLVERALRLEVDERMASTGQVLQPLDLAQAEQAAEHLVAQGVQAIAVSLLHAYANPAHEPRTRFCRSFASTSGPARPSSTPTCSRWSHTTCNRCAASSTRTPSRRHC